MTNPTVSTDTLAILSAYRLRHAVLDDQSDDGLEDAYDLFEVAPVAIGEELFSGEKPSIAFARGAEYGLRIAAAVLTAPLVEETDRHLVRISDEMRATLRRDAPHRNRRACAVAK